MKILHCIEKEVWEKMEGEKHPGKDLLEKNPELLGIENK